MSNIETSKEKIILKLNSLPAVKIIYIWDILYEKLEECPKSRAEALSLIEEELSCSDDISKIRKIYKKIFKAQEED